ncbi:MAG: sugar phosphate nucleotidyltransferase [Halobacteriaceae archaeon]
MKAVILAAGEGRRLEPLTNVRPKPMLPVANKPILEYIIEAVRDAGINDIILIVGYKRDRIQSYFEDGNDWDVDITYAIQETQLGTGDAVLHAEPYIGDDFIVLNGDRIIEEEVISAVIEERKQTEDLIMSVTRVDEPTLYGVVELDRDSVTAIREQPPQHAVKSDLINAGIYGFGPEIFSAIRQTESNGELELTKTLNQLNETRTIRAVRNTGVWLDVTRPWDLLTVNGELIDTEFRSASNTPTEFGGAHVTETTRVNATATINPGAVILRGSAIAQNVSIGANAVIENAIIMEDADIQAGAIVTDCIVGANASVGPGTIIEGGLTDVVLDGSIHHDVRFGGIIGDYADIGGDVTVKPGTRLGNDTIVSSGSVIEDVIPSGARVTRG